MLVLLLAVMTAASAQKRAGAVLATKQPATLELIASRNAGSGSVQPAKLCLAGGGVLCVFMVAELATPPTVTHSSMAWARTSGAVPTGRIVEVALGPPRARSA